MDELLRNALSDYKEEFGHDFDQSWQPTCEQDIAEKLQSSQTDFKSWRSKNARMWSALTAIVLPISNLGRIASDAGSAAFPPASAAMSGLMSLVTASEKVSESYDFIEQLVTKLEDALSRWRLADKHKIDDILKEKMQQILVLLLSIITRSRKLVKRRRPRQYLARLVFGEDRKTAEYVENLEALLQSEDRARSALTLEKINALWQKALQTESAYVVERLNSPAVKINKKAYADMLDDKIVGSGGWFKQDALYQLWMQHEIQLLMLLGGPGSGKSYLATSLIEDLVQIHRPHNTKKTTTSVAYFFYHPDDDLATMLKSIAYQIQETNDDYRKHVVETFDEGDLHTAREIWAKLFLDFWSDQVDPNARLMLVIDGLSEACPDIIENFVEDMVRPLGKGSGFNIQIALFGMLRLWDYLDFVPREGFVEVDSKKTEKDMATYIDQQMLKIRAIKSKSAQKKLELRNDILERCYGVFECARLLLSKCKNREEHQIRKMLKDPPKGLSDMIKSCFDQIMADEDIDPDMLRVLLTWLTYEKRPLRFGEVYNAVCLATGEEYTLMWRNIVRVLSSIIRWRTSRNRPFTNQNPEDDQGYVEQLDEDKGWSKQTSTTWISFANTQIRDYVLHQSELVASSKSDPEPWPPSMQQSECEIVKTCLKTLQKDDILEKHNRFLIEYPTRFMILHLQHVDMETVSHEDKAEIATGLIWLFRSETAHYAIAVKRKGLYSEGTRSFWRLWIETRSNTTLIQRWFSWALEADIAIESETKKWVRRAVGSVKDLFEPLADFLRRSWLAADWTPHSFEGPVQSDRAQMTSAAIAFLIAYDNMNVKEEFPERYQQHHRLTIYTQLPEDIIASSQRPGIPQNAGVFVGVGLALVNRGQSALAIEQLTKVPESDDTFWIAAWLLSRAYSSQSRIDQALYYTQKASELNPQIKYYSTEATSRLLLMSGRQADALSLTRQSYESDTQQKRNHWIYLRTLCICREHKAIANVLRTLHSQADENENYSHLTQALTKYIGAWFALGHTYMFSQDQRDRDFINDVIGQSSALIAQHEGEAKQIEWNEKVAAFVWRYVEDGAPKGVKMLLANISKVKDTKLVSDPIQKDNLLSATRAQAAYRIYLSAIEQELTADPDAARTIENLQVIVQETEGLDRTSLSMHNFWHSYYPDIYYGRWLRRHHPGNNEIWMKHLRPPLLHYTDMLDDLDPHNDDFALLYVHELLRYAGDYERYLALQAIMIRRSEKTASSSNNTKLASNGTGTQEGPRNGGDCRRKLPTHLHSNPGPELGMLSTANMNTGPVRGLREKQKEDASTSAIYLNLDRIICCSVCWVLVQHVDKLFECDTCDTTYCPKCIPTTDMHPMYGRVCRKDHTFMQIWPVSDEIMNSACVEVDGEFRLKRDWLNELREIWKAPEKDMEEGKA